MLSEPRMNSHEDNGIAASIAGCVGCDVDCDVTSPFAPSAIGFDALLLIKQPRAKSLRRRHLGVLRKNSGRDLLQSVIVVQATQTGAGNNAVRG